MLFAALPTAPLSIVFDAGHHHCHQRPISTTTTITRTPNRTIHQFLCHAELSGHYKSNGGIDVNAERTLSESEEIDSVACQPERGLFDVEYLCPSQW